LTGSSLEGEAEATNTSAIDPIVVPDVDAISLQYWRKARISICNRQTFQQLSRISTSPRSRAFGQPQVKSCTI